MIVRTEGVCGGRPRIAGTRITVDHLVTYRRVLLEELLTARLLKAFPHLTEEQLTAAFDYYREHQDEIDAILRENDAFLAAHGQPVPALPADLDV